MQLFDLRAQSSTDVPVLLLNQLIIDEGTWEQLKVKGVKCESQAPSPDKKLYPYASSQPLPV